MDPLRNNYRRLVTLNQAKQVIIFILLTFVYNFVVFPARAVEAQTLTPTTPSGTVIKNPASGTHPFTQLVAAKKARAQTDNRPALAKEFDLIASTPLPAFSVPTVTRASAPHTTASFSATDIPAGARELVVTMTAYNSEVAQTDGDPCTTANGFNVCKHGIEDTVAANFLPMGTRITIPDYFGEERVFVVRDRTARKYSNRVDVWMKHRSDALQFGKRSLRIVVLD